MSPVKGHHIVGYCEHALIFIVYWYLVALTVIRHQ